jgi:predicted dehydrogenase
LQTAVLQTAVLQTAVAADKDCAPTFRDALQTQQVCAAVLDSARTGVWVEVAKD